jgi:crossover junction endodeoxyribonuclease RusA
VVTAQAAPAAAGYFGYQVFGPWLTVEVRGLPAPQGSKSYKGQTKKGRPILAESSAALKPWRLQVQSALEDAMQDLRVRAARRDLDPWQSFPIEGPVAVVATFTMRKPKSAPKTRRTFPVTKPDVDKLLRAVLDAGTAAGVWGDDSQVIEETARKAYPREHLGALEVPGLTLAVYSIGAA